MNIFSAHSHEKCLQYYSLPLQTTAVTELQYLARLKEIIHFQFKRFASVKEIKALEVSISI